MNDAGLVTLRLAPKDIGTALNPDLAVVEQRGDHSAVPGCLPPRRRHGTCQGVDVPYGFDGAATGTVPPTGKLDLPFELVRHVAKLESPLVQLASNPTVITTIAEVTFFGADLVGNEINATGFIQVDFGNFADADN